jgi:GR25 family glycosyltransferase involved in LPS biosynthesis
VQNWERFNAVNGYAIPDDQPIQIKDQSVRFKDLYERMPGSSERHKRARLGCYLSHLFAIKQARDARLESVLIIEDDAIFPQTKRGVESFNSAIQELPNDWEVFFVGIEHDKKPSRFSAHVDHVQSGTCLHAYAVHSRAYDRLIDDIESALLNDQDQLLPVDEVVSEQLEKNKYKAFAPHTLVGYQRDGLTSNITGKVNSDYSFPMRLIKRLYSHMLAPVLSPLGLTKYRIYKTALSTAKRLNLGA